MLAVTVETQVTFDTQLQEYFSKAAAYHNTGKSCKMPVLCSLLPSLVYAFPVRQRLQKCHVGGRVLHDTLVFDCDMSLT